MYYSMKRRRKKPRTSTVLLFSLILFIFGLFLISYNYFVTKKEKIYSSMNLLLYEDEMPKNIETEKEEPEPSVPDDPVPERLADIGEDDKSITYNYIGILEISKLGIKKGFLNLESPYNNVNKNVTLIEYSTMPDVENGNLILAAHSGNCWVCYFDKLYMLSVGDKAAVTYNGYKYTYELKNIYNVPKTGTVEVRRDPSKTVLTLITCTRGSDTEQTVYIFELAKKEKK